MRIGIAGAGIGGLAAAAFLAQDGHDVRVFDQFRGPEPVGSGLVVQPVGMSVLAALGTLPFALHKGARIDRMFGREADAGRTVLDVSYGASGKDRFGLALHRSVLFEAVHRAALSAGAKLTASSQIVRCDLSDRRFLFANNKMSDPFDLIIDAAGASSPLSPIDAKVLPYGALWGTVDWPKDTELPFNQLSQMYRRADRMLGVLPVGQMSERTGRCATVFWSLPSDAYGAWRSQRLHTWIAQATELWPEFAPFVQQITQHDQMTMARYSHATLRRPIGPGICHIGDAAHRASPQLGQGANMALLDAYALAGALRQAEGQQALLLYARLRRWHVRLYQGMSYSFTPQYQSDSRWLPMLRDRVLAPISRVPPVPWVLSKLVCGDLIPPYAGLPNPATIPAISATDKDT